MRSAGTRAAAEVRAPERAAAAAAAAVAVALDGLVGRLVLDGRVLLVGREDRGAVALEVEHLARRGPKRPGSLRVDDGEVRDGRRLADADLDEPLDAQAALGDRA